MKHAPDIRRSGRRPATVGVLALLSGLVPVSAAARGPGITEEDLDIAIRRAVDYLWSQRDGDGGWDEARYGGAFPGGVSCLVVYALLEAGESPHDTRMIKALKHLEELGDVGTTYVRSFRALVWAALDPVKYRSQRNQDSNWLVRSQHESGGWGYPGTWGGNTQHGGAASWVDNSNTQIAMLALWATSGLGSEVPRSLWHSAEKYWVESQNADGGWGYRPPTGRFGGPHSSYGSMTAAGLATLHILYDRLHVGGEGRYTGTGAPRCGQHGTRATDLIAGIDAAVGWITGHFSLTEVPRADAEFARKWLGYYFYSIERAGVASGRKYVGDREWYPALVKEVLARQGADGSWGDLINTSFSLLSLLKGRAPIVINKLKYAGEDWNNDPRDAAKLTEWMSRVFERPFGWQTVETHKAAADLLDAPVLYFNGHEGPVLSEADREALIDYVWEGGTIVAVACCSKAKFAETCVRQFRGMFPQLQVAPIENDHPLWTMQYQLQQRLPVVGFSDRCRTRIFLVRQDICCAWHQGLWVDHRDLFELGANFYLYATAHAPQRTRLRPMFARAAAKPSEVWRVGRVRHDGDWDADPRAVEHLSAAMAEAFGVGLREDAVDLTTADPARTPFIWITGHDPIALSTEQAEGLQRFLRKGGTVLVDAGCGRPAFDESFTELTAGLFGQDALKPLSPQDPLLSGALPGALGADVSVVRLKRGAVEAVPGPTSPVLANVRLGGGLGLIYSRYGLACPCDGHPCVRCASYETASARAIVANIIMAAYQNIPAPPG